LKYEYLCEQDAENPYFVNITVRQSWTHTHLSVDPLINGSTVLLSSCTSTTNFYVHSFIFFSSGQLLTCKFRLLPINEQLSTIIPGCSTDNFNEG
jgi:hypothetical protein